MTRDDLVRRLVDLQREIGSTANGAHCYGVWARQIGEIIAALAAPPAAPSDGDLASAVDRVTRLRRDIASMPSRVEWLGGQRTRYVQRDEVLALVDAALAAPPAAPPADLVALVQEWQEARKPATLLAPGEFLAETFQAAVRRMSAADEALAAYRLDVGRACFLCDGTGGDEKIGDVDCHGCGGAGRVLPSLREELTEIIRWRFKTADGAPMNGPLVLKRAQEIANEIAPHIEGAVGER